MDDHRGAQLFSHSPFPVAPFTSLPNYRPYVLWVTLSRCIWCIWCIRWLRAEPRGCLVETAESVHSIFHIALLLTNRYAPLTRPIRIHPPDASNDTGRLRSHATRKIHLLSPSQNSIAMIIPTDIFCEKQKDVNSKALSTKGRENIESWILGNTYPFQDKLND